LKAFKKGDILMKNMLERIITEKDILKELQHPFLVRLRYSFQGHKKIYMAMDLCQGGDMANYLFKNKKLDEESAKFYAAEVILALQYIHEELDIIHRDIKPENIMFGSDGHLKLTDFGLAKSAHRTFSLCGTPEYVAPEIISGGGYGSEVDWWSLGCLLFEMVAGGSPFYKPHRSQLPLEILHAQPTIPDTFSPDLKDLILNLLAKDPKVRLGANGAQEIKAHSFFNNIDWDKMLKKENTPPFIPVLSGPEDVSYFHKTYDCVSSKGSPTGKQDRLKSSQTFQGITYLEDPFG